MKLYVHSQLCSERWSPSGIKLEQTWASVACVTQGAFLKKKKIQRGTKAIEQLMPGRGEEPLI